MPGLIDKAMSFVGWESGGAYLGAVHSIFGGDMSVTHLGGSNFDIGLGYDMPRLFSGDFTTIGPGYTGRMVDGVGPSTYKAGAALGFSAKAMIAGSAFGTGLLIMEGYTGANGYAGGLTGVAQAAGYEIGVNAALARTATAQWTQNIKEAGGINKISGMGRIHEMAKFGGKMGAGYFAGGIGYTIGSSVSKFGASLGGLVETPFSEMAGIYGGYAGSVIGATIGIKTVSNPLALAGALAAAGVGFAGYGAAQLGYGVAQAGYNHVQMQKRIDTSGSLAAFHTRGANTMRERSVQAMHKTHINARSALGQEASFFHNPSKSYHSRYRRF